MPFHHSKIRIVAQLTLKLESTAAFNFPSNIRAIYQENPWWPASDAGYGCSSRVSRTQSHQRLHSAEVDGKQQKAGKSKKNRQRLFCRETPAQARQ
jgi:hypothetical protein